MGAESGGPTADTTLSRVLGDRHAMIWPSNKPAWRVVVLKHLHKEEGTSPNQDVLERVDIAFLAHHAIADGISGLSFHTSLMKNLPDISTTTSPPTWPMTFNEILDAPPAVEECVNCLSCACTLCNASTACQQQVWAGAGITPELTASFKSMVRVVTVPAHRLGDILQRCKQSNVTLTGFLHALICDSLCRGIPQDQAGFRAVTPFSVRRHTGASDEDIVNHISFMTSYVPRARLNEIGRCETGSASEEHAIIQLAESFSRDIATKVRQLPHGGMVMQLSRIQDLLSHCRNKSGKQRQYTYELSNLGLTSNVVPPKGSGLKLEKVFFTQCGMVTGPAIGFNCVSVRGGPLTISITWQQGVVEESLVEHVARDLERI
ncbi:Alcohol acetyltransferase [Paecilomyces lecythidis]|uniref:Alcohol acetyltransferase n=1 Tax=Paecilomyces lecythidis TaxID=3004212 RepID=A0ABR3YAW7_9EURO